MQMKLKLVVACFLLTVLGSAQAQQERVYWGTSFGNGNPDRSQEDNQRNYAQSRGWGNVHSWRENHGGSMKVFRGVVNDSYWATEIGLAFLGETAWITQAYQNNRSKRQEAYESAQALYVDKLRFFGGADHWRVYGRVGVAITKTKLDSRVYDDGGTDVYSSSVEQKIQPKLGLGLQYRLNDDWHIRAETERYLSSDYGVTTLGLVKFF